MIGAILPILLIVIILIVSGFTTWVFGARIMKGVGMTRVFTGYIIVLLIASVFSFFLPEKESFAGRYVTNKELMEQQRLSDKIYSIIEEGKIAEADGLIEKDSWSFPLEGNVLNINSYNQNSAIFIEKVDGLDGNIEVSHYMTKSYINNVDVTDRFTSPRVEFMDSKLSLYPAEVVEVKVVQFGNPFPFSQFSGNEIEFPGYFGMNHGMEFIYIRIPEGTEINGEGHLIN